MTKTATAPWADQIDADLRNACATRDKAWRDLMVKDSTEHRDAWDAACEQVDGLLDLRHEMTAQDDVPAY